MLQIFIFLFAYIMIMMRKLQNKKRKLKHQKQEVEDWEAFESFQLNQDHPWYCLDSTFLLMYSLIVMY